MYKINLKSLDFQARENIINQIIREFWIAGISFSRNCTSIYFTYCNKLELCSWWNRVENSIYINSIGDSYGIIEFA